MLFDWGAQGFRLRHGSLLTDAQGIASKTIPLVDSFSNSLALLFNVLLGRARLGVVFRKLSREVALQVLVAAVAEFRPINLPELVHIDLIRRLFDGV